MPTSQIDYNCFKIQKFQHEKVSTITLATSPSRHHDNNIINDVQLASYGNCFIIEHTQYR